MCTAEGSFLRKILLLLTCIASCCQSVALFVLFVAKMYWCKIPTSNSALHVAGLNRGLHGAKDLGTQQHFSCEDKLVHFKHLHHKDTNNKRLVLLRQIYTTQSYLSSSSKLEKHLCNVPKPVDV